MVILHDELTKHPFWRLGIVTELLTGMDNVIRAAIVKTVNLERTQLRCRSIKHLIPVELKANTETSDNSATATNEMHPDPPSRSRPSQRQADTITGERQR